MSQLPIFFARRPGGVPIMPKRIALFFLSLTLLLTAGCAAKGPVQPDFTHGSAGAAEGRTLVISIFADDPDYAWTASAEDTARMAECCEYLRIAADYTADVAAAYGKRADIVADFEAHPDLCYRAAFPASIVSDDGADAAVWQFIDAEIDVPYLLSHYDAPHCVFFLFLNTDAASTPITCTRTWYESMPYPYEIVYLYRMDSGVVNCPAVYAHELFHAFGAPDYYMPDPEFAIGDDFVAYAAQAMPYDIMNCCSDPATDTYIYDAIYNPVSDLTAYYIGLTDHCDLAEQWGLAPSQHR